MGQYGFTWACGPVWVHIGLYVPIRAYGPVCVHIGLYGPTWTLGTHGARWTRIDLYEPMWAHIGPYEPVWVHICPYGDSFQIADCGFADCGFADCGLTSDCGLTTDCMNVRIASDCGFHFGIWI